MNVSINKENALERIDQAFYHAASFMMELTALKMEIQGQEKTRIFRRLPDEILDITLDNTIIINKIS